MSQDTSQCRDAAQHDLHICQLAKKGFRDEIASRKIHPSYICHNCNATADRAEDLCNPSPMASR